MPAVLMIGPPPTMIGGIASVMEQMVSLDFGGRYHLKAFPITVSAGESESTYRKISRHMRQLWRLTRAIRQVKPAIVHIHTCSGFSLYRSALDMIVAQRMGCRVILHVHGASFDKFHTDASALQSRAIAWSLSRADRVVALSTTWEDKLRAIAPKASVNVIENAVSIPDEVPARDHTGPCRFLLLARMDEWKGVDDLLDAAAGLRRDDCAFELVLAGPAGTAGDAVTLDEKIHARGLQPMVRYAGPVQGEQKARLFRWADTYVQPSHHEGMPLSLLEAMSYGLPIVATRVGAVPEVVGDAREGLLVPPHRSDQLARAMRALLSDDSARRTMGLAARRLAVSRFSLNRLRDDVVSLYNDVLESKGTAKEVCEQQPFATIGDPIRTAH